MSNEQQIANYIYQTASEDLKAFGKNYIFTAIRFYNIEKFAPYNLKLVKQECIKLNINIKIDKTKQTIYASFV